MAAELTINTALKDDKFERLRREFPMLNHPQKLHYLDSAASSQKPNCVIDAVTDCYRSLYSPVHRGLYPAAAIASEQYEMARQTLANFINAEQAENIVFTRSATEAINLVAMGWALEKIQHGDEICISEMEHHANFLPWQRLCKQRGAKLTILPIDKDGLIQVEQLKALLNKRTRLIAITHLSNVLGVVNPIKEITSAAKAFSIPVLVDAAQSIGHLPVDVQALDCDFLVASAHKMCGPTGIGFLYAKQERLTETEPLLLGGGMVDEVKLDVSTWADIPARFEAGSPNLSGAAGFSVAAQYLKGIGLDSIAARIKALTLKTYEILSRIPGVTIYGSCNGEHHSGIISFTIDDIHPHDIAHIVGEHQVAIRAGHHCCQPLMRALGISSTARVSLYFYNNEDDILALEKAIYQLKKIFNP